MAKYRLLTREELHELEKEFIDFLILNGITADEWVRIKKNKSGKAKEIMDLFSDVVFEGIMRNTQYLERRSRKKLEALQCLNDRFVMVCLDAEKVSHVDLADPDFIRKAAQEPPKGLEIFTIEVKYKNQRELELFEMVQQGFDISDPKLFKQLCMALPQN